MTNYYGIVTDIGTAAFANAAFLGTKVNITQMVVGDGNGAYYLPISDQTTLRREVWVGSINSVKINPANPNVIRVEAVIPSSVGGFTIRELGALDADGNLIAVANTPDMQKVVLEDGAASEFVVGFEVAVSNADAVEFTVDPTLIIATKQDIAVHAANSNIHVTTEEKENWDSKAAANHTHTAADVGADPAGTAAKAQQVAISTAAADATQKAREAEQNAKDASIPLSQKGAAGGVPELNAQGLLDSQYLPSYVDDVLEGNFYDGVFYKDADHKSRIEPEGGKLYIDLINHVSYRWSGTIYARVDEGVILGETRETAGRGDWTKAAYEHSLNAEQHVTPEDKAKLAVTPGPTHNHSGQSLDGEDGSGGPISYIHLTDKPEKMTPIRHADTHMAGGIDPITPASIGALSTEEAKALTGSIAHLDTNFIGLALEVEVLKGAALTGVNANIFLESFINQDDFTLTNGIYEKKNRRVYLPLTN